MPRRSKAADVNQTRIQVYVADRELEILNKLAETLGGISTAARLAIVYGAPIALARIEAKGD
jgi:hypothetical protein